MKFSRNKLVLSMALLGLTSMVSVSVYAAKPADTSTTTTTLPAVPLNWTAGTAIVDGNTSDWNLSTDASTRMCEAGWINTDGSCNGKEQLSTLYTRYDCNTNTMYVLVLKTAGHTADNSASWVKVYTVGNSPRVQGPSNSANFHDVTVGGVVQGYEASFTLAAGTYNDVEVHLEVDGSRTSSTGKVQYTRSIVVPENCTVPTSTTTPTTSGTAGPTSGTVGGYSGFNNWGQCQSAMSGGTTLSVVGRLLPAAGVNYNDTSVTGEVYNNSDTPQTVTLVSYKEFYPDTNFDDKTDNGVLVPGQRVNDYQTVTVPAKGHVNLTAQLPGCSTQIDLVCADVIQYLGGGNLYGARKLAYYHAHQPNNGWCNSTGVTSWNGAFEAAAQAAADQAAADAAAKAAADAAAKAAADQAAADAAAKAAADAAAKAAADQAAADAAAKDAADKAAADKAVKDAKAAKDAADAEAKKQADEAAAAKAAKDAADAEAKKQADEAAAAKAAKDAADAEAQKQADEAAAAAKVASDAAEANAKKQAEEAAAAAKAAEDAAKAAEDAAKAAEDAKAADKKQADEAAAAAKADEEAKAAEAKKQAEEAAAATKTAEEAKVGEDAADKTAKEVADKGNSSNENSANDSANGKGHDPVEICHNRAHNPIIITIDDDGLGGSFKDKLAGHGLTETDTVPVNPTPVPGGGHEGDFVITDQASRDLCVGIPDVEETCTERENQSISEVDSSSVEFVDPKGNGNSANDSENGKGHQPVAICHNVPHNPHVIVIDDSALQAHLKHLGGTDFVVATDADRAKCGDGKVYSCGTPAEPVTVTGAFYNADDSICSYVPEARQNKNGKDLSGWTLPQWIAVDGYIEATKGGEPAGETTVALVGNNTVKICPVGMMVGDCHEGDATGMQSVTTNEEGKADFVAVVYWPGVPTADRDNGAVKTSYSINVMGGPEGTTVVGGLAKNLLWNNGMMNNKKGCTLTLKAKKHH